MPRPRLNLRQLVEHLRHFQLALVLGFAGAGFGALLAAPLVDALASRAGGHPRLPVRIAIVFATQLGALVVVPALCFALGRFVALVPWPFALGTLFVEQSVHVELESLMGGREDAGASTLGAGVRLAALVLAAVTAAGALRRARESARKAEQVSATRKAEQEAEYAAFLASSRGIPDAPRE